MVKTVVSTSAPLTYPSQRNTLEYNFRQYVFYINSSLYFCYKKSNNGIDWSEEYQSNLRVPDIDIRPAVWLESSAVNVVCGRNTNSWIFMQGFFSVDGIINWGEMYNICSVSTGSWMRCSSICKTTDNQYWAATGYYSDAKASVLVSSDNGQTWSRSWNVPSSSSYVQTMVIVVPLTAGKLAFMYARGEETSLQLRIYSGGWGGANSYSMGWSTYYKTEYVSAVAINDTIYILARTGTKSLILLSFTSSFSLLGTVDADTTYEKNVAISKRTDDILDMFWSKNSQIYHQTYTISTNQFSSTDNPFGTSEDTAVVPHSYYQKSNFNLGCCWQAKAASPYDIRFNFYPNQAIQLEFLNLYNVNWTWPGHTILAEIMPCVDFLRSPQFNYLFEARSLSDLFWRVNPWLKEGFESNSFSTNGWSTVASPTIVQSPIHHGGYSLYLVNTTSQGDAIYKTFTSKTKFSVRFFVYWSTFATYSTSGWSGGPQLIIGANNPSYIFTFGGDSSDGTRRWCLSNRFNSSKVYSTDLISTGVWYQCEVVWNNGGVTAYINGIEKLKHNASVSSVTRIDFGSTTAGTGAAAQYYYLDDIAIDDNPIGRNFDPVGPFGRSCYELRSLVDFLRSPRFQYLLENLNFVALFEQIGAPGGSTSYLYWDRLWVFTFTMTKSRVLYAAYFTLPYNNKNTGKAVVYEKIDGASTAKLIAVGPEVGPDVYLGYFTFSPPVRLFVGRTYYIGLITSNTSAPGYGKGNLGTITCYSRNITYPNAPDPLGSVSSWNYTWDVTLYTKPFGEIRTSKFLKSLFETSILNGIILPFLFKKIFTELSSMVDSIFKVFSFSLPETLNFMRRLFLRHIYLTDTGFEMFDSIQFGSILYEVSNFIDFLFKFFTTSFLENLSFNDFLRRGSRLLEILFLSESLSKRILKRMGDELISLLDDLRNNVSKRIGEMFSSIDSIVKSTSKFLSEEISLLPLIAQFGRWILDEMHFSDLIRSFGEILGESMRLSSQPSFSIGKVLRDTLNLIELIFPGLIPRIRKTVKLLIQKISRLQEGNG